MAGRKTDLKLGTEAGLEHIDKPAGLGLEIGLEICPNQRRAETPEAVSELYLCAFLRTPFPQGPGDEQKMTHDA
jgi:hypothetical protein